MVNHYVPEKGDVVWLEFDPQSGHEQKGRRPAIVLSPLEYNQKTELAVFCPITSKEKGYPFEVNIHNSKIQGIVLADQVKSLDWKERKATYIVKASEKVLDEVVGKVLLLIAE